MFLDPETLRQTLCNGPHCREGLDMSLGFQLHDSRAGAAFARGSEIEFFDVRVRGEHFVESLLQDSLAMAVNHPQAEPPGEVRFVEELIHALASLFRGCADHINFRSEGLR